MAEAEVGVVCPKCRKRGQLPHRLIGEWVDCPKCGHPFLATADVVRAEVVKQARKREQVRLIDVA